MEGAWVALALTLKVALWATALNLVLGVGIGFAMARWRFPGRDLLDAVLTLPMVMPPTVLGYYLLVRRSARSGPIGGWLMQHFGIRLIFTWQGAVIAATVVAFPLVFKGARAAFETVDPQLEDAARTLGIREIAVFFRVSLPLAWRGILAGLLLSFARALGEFGATLMVAGSIPGRTQTLSIAVYEAVQAGQDDAANFLVRGDLDRLHRGAAGGGPAGAGARAAAQLRLLHDLGRRAQQRVLHDGHALRARRALCERCAATGPVRAIGRRQDADAEDDRRHRAARPRPRGGGRPTLYDSAARHSTVAAGAAAGLRVPGLRAVPAPDACARTSPSRLAAAG